MSLCIKKVARIVVGCCTLLVAVTGFGQDVESARRPTKEVTPAYPELARRMKVSGTVKLEVSVTPEGEVRSSKPIGGNPVLIQAAESAVKQWKFAPSAKPSVEVVTFHFNAE